MMSTTHTRPKRTNISYLVPSCDGSLTARKGPPSSSTVSRHRPQSQSSGEHGIPRSKALFTASPRCQSTKPVHVESQYLCTSECEVRKAYSFQHYETSMQLEMADDNFRTINYAQPSSLLSNLEPRLRPPVVRGMRTTVLSVVLHMFSNIHPPISFVSLS